MSVDLGQSLEAGGLDEAAMVPVGFGAVRLRVGRVRLIGLRVGSDPISEASSAHPTGNPHHGQVWGVKTSYKRKLRDLVEDWVVPLRGVALR